MSNLIGQILLNQYRVDAFIASGGMGAVYRVWDLRRNVPLAMKVLHADLVDDPSAFKYFQREANALRKLAHPHIVPFYGLYKDEDYVFILEEFIDGQSLQEILRKKPGGLSIADALVYIKDVCSALGYAHASGVVHCDIKPGNVMVDRTGKIYLADFGIARHAQSTTTTIAGAGTPAYMAPEQIRAEQVLPATDVYALGILLYEILTGQRPFRGDEPAAMQAGNTSGLRVSFAHLTLPPPDPSKINPSIPPALSAVILKALSKRPEERYSDAQSFYLAVRQVVDQLSENQPNPLPVTPQNSKPVIATINRKYVGFIVGGLVLIMLGVYAAQMIKNSSANKTPDPITPQSIVSTATISAEVTSTPIPQATRTSVPSPVPVSKKILFSMGAKEIERSLYTLDIETKTTTKIASFPKGVNFAAASHDGNKIIFSGRTGNQIDAWNLYLMDIPTGQSSVITEKAVMPDWCQDSNQSKVVYEIRNGDNSNIWMTDLSNSEKHSVTANGSGYRPKWNPGCTKIVFTQYSDSTRGDTVIYDLADGSTKKLTTTSDDDVNPIWSPDGNWIAFVRRDQDTNGDGYINGNDRSNLFLMSPDGNNLRALINGGYSVFSPTWSPDSKEIVFTAYFGAEEMQIILYSLQNDQTSQLTGRGPYYHTRWMP